MPVRPLMTESTVAPHLSLAVPAQHGATSTRPPTFQPVQVEVPQVRPPPPPAVPPPPAEPPVLVPPEPPLPASLPPFPPLPLEPPSSSSPPQAGMLHATSDITPTPKVNLKEPRIVHLISGARALTTGSRYLKSNQD